MKKGTRYLSCLITLWVIILAFAFSAHQTKGDQSITFVTSPTGRFRLVSNVTDIVNPEIAPYLDILSVTIETDDNSSFRFNWTLRGDLPSASLFVNKTLDDDLSYACWIDTDKNPLTGQPHRFVGSEYNLMFQASGGSPMGQWGARVDDLGPTGQYLGSSPVEFSISQNTFSLIVKFSQIGYANSFDWSVTTWGKLNGTSLGSNPETPAQLVTSNVPFELSIPPLVSVVRGRSSTMHVYVESAEVFVAPIDLEVTLPDGLVASWIENTTTPNNTVILVINALSNATLGYQRMSVVGNSQGSSLTQLVWVDVEEPPPPFWTESWFWILFGGVVGIVITSSALQYYYIKWRKTRIPLDVDYLTAASALSKLEELKLLNKISQQEYEERREEYEQKLKGK
jgi:hypothetical protein